MSPCHQLCVLFVEREYMSFSACLLEWIVLMKQSVSIQLHAIHLTSCPHSHWFPFDFSINLQTTCVYRLSLSALSAIEVTRARITTPEICFTCSLKELLRNCSGLWILAQFLNLSYVMIKMDFITTKMGFMQQSNVLFSSENKLINNSMCLWILASWGNVGMVITSVSCFYMYCLMSLCGWRITPVGVFVHVL